MGVQVFSCMTLRAGSLFEASSHVPEHPHLHPTAISITFMLLLKAAQKGHRMYGTITNSVAIAPLET